LEKLIALKCLEKLSHPRFCSLISFKFGSLKECN